MSRSLKKQRFNPTISFVTADGLLQPNTVGGSASRTLRRNYNSQNSLEAWYNFDERGLERDSSGKGRNGTIANIVISNETPYTSDRAKKSVNFNGSDSTFTLDNSLTNLASNTKWSFCFWTKFENTSGTNVIFDLGSIGNNLRIRCSSGNLTITDDAWSGTSSSYTFNSVVPSGAGDQWTFICITFDRTNAGYIPNVYANVVEATGFTTNTIIKHTADSSTASTGNRSDFSTTSCCIGSNTALSQKINAKVALFAIWSSILDSENVQAIFNATNGVHEIQSGIISNPVRILLQEKDSHTGSYPTIARTGDSDFTGKYSVFYDDTDTINFVGNNSTVYPNALPSLSKWVSGGIATPNILQGLITAGTASKGVADAQVSFTPGQNISPFNESRIYIDNDSTFYQTGTDQSILPGFDQRLSSKAILNFDISCNVRSDIYWSTGTVGHSSPYANSLAGYNAGIRSGIAYYSWNDKQWQTIGDLTTGSNVDYANPSVKVFTGSYLAQANSRDFNSFDSSESFFSASLNSLFTNGQPTNVAGFPVASKFDATGSQMLSLSGSISSPFLVEKVVLTLGSASLRTEAGGWDPWNFGLTLPQNVTFVLMHETGPEISTKKYTTVNRANSYSVYVDETEFIASFNVKKNREIIWFGRVATYDETANTSPMAVNPNVLSYITSTYPTIYSGSETWLPATNEVFKPFGYRGAYTGSIRIEAPSRLVPNSKKALSPGPGAYYNGSSGLYPNRSTNEVGVGYVNFSASPEKGGRNLFDEASGHSFIKTIPGSRVLAITPVNWQSASPGSYYNVETRNLSFEISPFILLPNSRLILAVISQRWNDYELDIVNKNFGKLSIFPAESKLTMYGSLLRNNLPVSPENNQPLTSEAIHEALHYDNPVFDQFDVEPISALTGSYIDLIITGSMFATPIDNPSIAANVRKVQCSIAAGQAGTTGSLQRFVNLTSEIDAYYDSYVPDFSNVANSLGKGYLEAGGSTSISIGAENSTVKARTGQISVGTWFRSFPFASNVTRQIGRNSLSTLQAPSYDFSNVIITSGTITNLVNPFYSSVGGAGFIYGSGPLSSIQNSKKYLWCFGDGEGTILYGNPALVVVDGPAVSSAPIVRGTRYGLINPFEMYSNVKFRRDRYGQFRDMLEQSPNAAFLVKNAVEYPVEIKFYSRPSKDGKGRLPLKNPTQTHSQNLSSFATSSLPYFDGVARERTDNPDLTVADVSI